MSKAGPTNVINKASADPAVSRPETSEVVAFEGKVVYINLEGGFWAVITEQGQKLGGSIPVNLRLNNQKISGFYQPQKDMMSFRMWGTLVKFSQLQAVGKPGESGKDIK